MEKLMLIVGISLIMSGCNLAGENNTDSSNSSVVSSITKEGFEESAIESASSSMESKQSSADTTTDSSEPGGAGTGGIVENSEKNDSNILDITTDEIPLVPQKSDIENGFTLESDPVLQEVEERMRQAEKIGIPNDVAIHFTGMTLNESGKTQAIFILVNLTNRTMKNINMTISFSNTVDEVILDKATFVLSEDRFGIFKPNTAMPVYIDIPKETEEIFNDLKDFNEMIYTIDSFDYEEI
ncbi:hypothetical protein [Carnobacterium funditum]|uniref:hypothetical protein n=1 Tax=Carnobacterium funditum TaxID=2752 RepID=UPI00054F55FD|nr:hypothetical protein [Carnobacterium funditum]